jgi:hypothetical protein
MSELILQDMKNGDKTWKRKKKKLNIPSIHEMLFGYKKGCAGENRHYPFVPTRAKKTDTLKKKKPFQSTSKLALKWANTPTRKAEV